MSRKQHPLGTASGGPTPSSSPNTFLPYIHGFTAERHTKSLWFILPLGATGSEVYCLQILKIANSSHNRKLILYTIPHSSPSIGHPCEPAAPAGAKAPDWNSSVYYFGPVVLASNTKGNQQNGLFLGKREKNGEKQDRTERSREEELQVEAWRAAGICLVSSRQAAFQEA